VSIPTFPGFQTAFCKEAKLCRTITLSNLVITSQNLILIPIHRTSTSPGHAQSKSRDRIDVHRLTETKSSPMLEVTTGLQLSNCALPSRDFMSRWLLILADMGEPSVQTIHVLLQVPKGDMVTRYIQMLVGMIHILPGIGNLASSLKIIASQGPGMVIIAQTLTKRNSPDRSTRFGRESGKDRLNSRAVITLDTHIICLFHDT